jgi:DNA-binding NarL/FixJ family response regulator
MISKLKLKVMLYDPDFYGRYAINSYLAWDRRTRVVYLAPSVEAIFEWLGEHVEVEWPDVVILDTYSFATSAALKELIYRLQHTIRNVLIIILDRELRVDYALAAIETGTGAYFLRNDVGLQIAWAVVWAQRPEFAISMGVKLALPPDADERLQNAAILPEQRRFPELTDRIREAIKLCVVEGMSADLAADEMGVSVHTVRSYIKEGYRVLESYEIETEFPAEMSAQERAFMRFTALNHENDAPPVRVSDDETPEKP